MLRNNRSTFIVLGLAFLILSFSSIAQAVQLQVAYVGITRASDQNSCTRNKPCRNIEKAVNIVATGGTVIILDTGDYLPFGTSRSVTVEAAPGITATVVTATGSGIMVGGIHATVTLRGLTLKGLANSDSGIRVIGHLRTLHIENCSIYDFKGVGQSPLNRVAGISISGDGEFFISDTVIKNVVGSGVVFDAAIDPIVAYIDHCRVENNSQVGFFVLGNSVVTVDHSTAISNLNDGFLVSGVNAKLMVFNSLSSGNEMHGFEATSGSDLTIDHCVAANNRFQGLAQAGNIVHISNSALVQNRSCGLSGDTRTIHSSGNNIYEGNFSGNCSTTFSLAPAIVK